MSLVLVTQAELRVSCTPFDYSRPAFPGSSSGFGVPFDGRCVSRLGGGLSIGPCSSPWVSGALGVVGCAIDALAEMELRCDGG